DEHLGRIVEGRVDRRLGGMEDRTSRLGGGLPEGAMPMEDLADGLSCPPSAVHIPFTRITSFVVAMRRGLSRSSVLSKPQRGCPKHANRRGFLPVPVGFGESARTVRARRTDGFENRRTGNGTRGLNPCAGTVLQGAFALTRGRRLAKVVGPHWMGHNGRDGGRGWKVPTWTPRPAPPAAPSPPLLPMPLRSCSRSTRWRSF